MVNIQGVIQGGTATIENVDIDGNIHCSVNLPGSGISGTFIIPVCEYARVEGSIVGLSRALTRPFPVTFRDRAGEQPMGEYAVEFDYLADTARGFPAPAWEPRAEAEFRIRDTHYTDDRITMRLRLTDANIEYLDRWKESNYDAYEYHYDADAGCDLTNTIIPEGILFEHTDHAQRVCSGIFEATFDNIASLREILDSGTGTLHIDRPPYPHVSPELRTLNVTVCAENAAGEVEDGTVNVTMLRERVEHLIGRLDERRLSLGTVALDRFDDDGVTLTLAAGRRNRGSFPLPPRGLPTVEGGEARFIAPLTVSGVVCEHACIRVIAVSGDAREYPVRFEDREYVIEIPATTLGWWRRWNRVYSNIDAHTAPDDDDLWAEAAGFDAINNSDAPF